MSNQPDQLQPRALCTLIDVVKRVPGYEAGEDGETDDILNDLIVQESRDFTDATRREIIAKNDDTVRIFDVDWMVVEDRELDIGDAATVTAVVLKQQDGTVIQTLDSTAWMEDPRVRDDWEPINALTFPRLVLLPAQLWWETRCEVTATWGFPMIPDTVRRAVATLVVFRYLNDTAAAGTAFADAANRAEFDLSTAIKAALDVRDRLTIKTVG